MDLPPGQGPPPGRHCPRPWRPRGRPPHGDRVRRRSPSSRPSPRPGPGGLSVLSRGGPPDVDRCTRDRPPRAPRRPPTSGEGRVPRCRPRVDRDVLSRVPVPAPRGVHMSRRILSTDWTVLLRVRRSLPRVLSGPPPLVRRPRAHTRGTVSTRDGPSSRPGTGNHLQRVCPSRTLLA